MREVAQGFIQNLSPTAKPKPKEDVLLKDAPSKGANEIVPP